MSDKPVVFKEGQIALQYIPRTILMLPLIKHQFGNYTIIIYKKSKISAFTILSNRLKVFLERIADFTADHGNKVAQWLVRKLGLYLFWFNTTNPNISHCRENSDCDINTDKNPLIH